MFKLRTATADDTYILFYWRNDPETRKMSVRTHKISILEHLKYIGAVLDSDSIGIFMFLKDDVPVGTIRHEWEVNKIMSHELSWTIAPEFRNQGLGVKMLQAYIKHTGIKSYCAFIKPENIGSMKIAESIGMKVTEGNDKLLFYEKE